MIETKHSLQYRIEVTGMSEVLQRTVDHDFDFFYRGGIFCVTGFANLILVSTSDISR